MDKLQWFKFSPSDWMMGKIQRCPEITQARFIRLCCLYWNKESNLLKDDAIIEIDQEHYDILISKNIISDDGAHVFIDFLNEQLEDITELSKSKSKAAKARWNKYNNKEVNSTSNADAMHVHKGAMQNDAEKRREEERRGEETRQEKQKKEKPFNFRLSLIELGVDEKVAEDWMKVRKTKKATNTETAFNLIKSQIQQSGKSPNECITLCVFNSWSGFKAEYVKNKVKQEYTTSAPPEYFR